MSAFRQEFILACQGVIFIFPNFFGKNRLDAFPVDASGICRWSALSDCKTP
jgi:hypothetical protein